MAAKKKKQNPSDDIQGLLAIHDDPVLFVRTWLGADPESWQADFLTNVAQNDRVAVVSAHGVGKTTALAWLILWFLLTRFPCKVGITAPSAAQLDNALWPELMSWRAKLPEPWKSMITMTSDRAYLTEAPESAFAVARTASKDRPEALQGIHAEHVLFVIDEATGVDEAVFSAALSSLSTKGAKVVMASNPTRVSGYFFNAFHKTAHLWKTQRVTAFDSSYSRQGTLIDEIRARSGEDSDEWRIRILGQFPTSDNDAVCSRELVEDATRRHVEVSPTAPIVWGLDVARMGADRTALCRRQGGKLLGRIEHWSKADLMVTASRVFDRYQALPEAERPQEIYVDAIGVGAGVADRLRELGLPVKGVNVAESPSSKERFLRLRDELWWKAREFFEARDCSIPDDDALINELCSIRYRYEPSMKIKVESKDEMKKRGHRSPDIADAFVLTMMNTAQDAYKRAQFFKPLKIDTDWVL